MKLNKTMFIICIAILSIFTIAQLSYAYTMMVNLSQKTDGPVVTKTVVDEVKKTDNNLKNPGVLDGGRSYEMIVSDLLAGNKLSIFKQELLAHNKDGDLDTFLASIGTYAESHKIPDVQKQTLYHNLQEGLAEIGLAPITTDIVEKLQADETAVVNLSAVMAAADIGNISDMKAYAIGLSSVGLAKVSVDGNKYNFMDTTLSPRIFSDTYVLDPATQQEFTEKVAELQPDEIAVILLITATQQDIEKALKERGVSLDRIAIVEATTAESRTMFGELINQYKEGFSLRSVNRNSLILVKALNGAI